MGEVKNLNEYQFRYTKHLPTGWGVRAPHNIATTDSEGFIVGNLSWGDGGVIADVYVDPSHRGRGLSDFMLEQSYLHSMATKGEIPSPQHADPDNLSPEGAKFAKRTWWAGQDDPDTDTISYGIKTN
jgi:GNAT superfamily N-acetyltransferase